MRTTWQLALGCMALAVAATACADGSSSAGPGTRRSTTAQASRTPATPAPRPAGVPTDATYIDVDRSYGGSQTAPAEAPPPQLSSLDCKDGVLTIVMPQVVELYAALPCDRAASQSVADLFLGRPVTIRIEVADAEKLRLESATAGTLEFTVSGVWAKE